MSSLVEHARREMEMINEEPDTIEGLCKVIRAYADMHVSGGQHSITLPMLVELLDGKNLSPLTNDPDEWEKREVETLFPDESPLWQNRRNSEAFSTDGGKTFYLLGETLLESPEGESPLHVAVSMKPRVVE